MLLSTHAFLKSISNVSGKDIGPLIKQWVYPKIFMDPYLMTDVMILDKLVPLFCGLETQNNWGQYSIEASV